MKMEDDGEIATTVVMKARSAYTWLDKLRFLKGLLPPPPEDVSRKLWFVKGRPTDRHGTFYCAYHVLLYNILIDYGWFDIDIVALPLCCVVVWYCLFTEW